MFKFSPGIIIAMLGLIGLMFTLVEGNTEIGSKIPIALFFLIIIVVGMVIEMTPEETLEGIYGEVEGKREFG